MIEKIGRPAMLEQLAEEASELAQACLKLARKERDETIEMMRNFPYPRWTPFSWRPLTEEEKKYHDDWCFTTDSELPEDKQEILVSDGRNVWKDVFYNDGEIYFDSGSDIDDAKAWMPLPKPYKEEA